MAAKRSKQKQTSPTRAHAASAPRPAKLAGRGSDRLGQLERLIELMVAKDVVEVELEEAGTRWRVRRTEPHAVTYAAAPMALPAAPLPHPGFVAGAPAAAGQAGAGPGDRAGEIFKSPMLGTYYQAASPDAEPFVKIGDRVTPDRTLCIIEAMKVMNEIKAERDFEILDILVKNGEPVEYGQPLFLIR